MVLLRCASVRGGGPVHGLLADDASDVAASWSRHDLLRPAVPEPGHDAPRGIRQPDCAPAAARVPRQGQHRVRRRGLRPLSGPMDLPRPRAADSGLHRRTRRRRGRAKRTGARGPCERARRRRRGRALAHSTIGPFNTGGADRQRARPHPRRSDPGATAVHQQGRVAVVTHQRAPAPRRVPEPRLLPEAAVAALHRAHPSHHLPRGGLPPAPRAPPRVRRRRDRAAPIAGCDAGHRRPARGRTPHRAPIPRHVN